MAIAYLLTKEQALRELMLSQREERAPILDGADLSGADLRHLDLSGGNMSEIDLSDTNLSGAYLCGAYLRKASLSGARLLFHPIWLQTVLGVITQRQIYSSDITHHKYRLKGRARMIAREAGGIWWGSV